MYANQSQSEECRYKYQLTYQYTNLSFSACIRCTFAILQPPQHICLWMLQRLQRYCVCTTCLNDKILNCLFYWLLPWEKARKVKISQAHILAREHFWSQFFCHQWHQWLSKLFTISSSPEPLSQCQLNLTQSILLWTVVKFVQRKGQFPFKVDIIMKEWK